MNTRFPRLKDQSGAALVVALVMMIVLTLVGLASIFTSAFEIKLSGNKRGSTDAFFAADSGVQVVMADPHNFDLPGKYDVEDKYRYSAPSTNYNPTKANIVVFHKTTESGPPRGMGISATGGVDFVHYVIESTGTDQTDFTPNKSVCTLEQKVVRLVPTM